MYLPLLLETANQARESHNNSTNYVQDNKPAANTYLKMQPPRIAHKLSIMTLLFTTILLLANQLAYCGANNAHLHNSHQTSELSGNIISRIAQSDIGRTISQIRKRHTEKDFAPKLIHQPQNVLLQPNKPHTIECPIESKPEAEVKWFKDDQLLASQPPHLEQTGSELMFFQVNDEDTGEYHCQATNYLGSIESEHFQLTVQSSVHDPKIRLEPRAAEVGQDQQVEFTCRIPMLSNREQQRVLAQHRHQQRSKQMPEVSWRRNGRRLAVKWLELAGGGDEEGEEIVSTRESQPAASNRFVGRQISASEFVLTITRAQLKDDNATLTCLYRLSSQAVDDTQAEMDGEFTLAHESSPAKLRVVSESQRRKQTIEQDKPVKLADVNLGPPIDNLAGAKNPHELFGVNTQQQQHGQQQDNQTTRLEPIMRIKTLRETLGDLYEIARPTLIIFGLLFFVCAIVILQLVYIRRRTRQNRYMKHQYTGSSGGSGTSSSVLGIGVGVGGIDCGVDPVLSSLMGRTLSTAPSAASLGCGVAAGKKYRSYRDHMRKVAAANNDQHLVSANDLVDGYFATHNHHLHQQHNQDHEPFFGTTALPNLYNQSLAAREQARTLLQQASEQHMRSLSNLDVHHHHVAASKQHQQQSALRFSQNGSHLNLPLSFAFGSTANTNSSANRDLLPPSNRLLDGPAQLLAAGAIWPPHMAQLAARAGQQTALQQQQSRQQLPADAENYQLVNCSSISPSSSSHTSADNTSHLRQQLTSTVGESAAIENQQQQHLTAPDTTSLNHYSTIGNNDDEDRYEEVDNHHSSSESATSIKRQHQQQQDSFRVSRTSTFVVNNNSQDTLPQTQMQPGNQKSSLRSSSNSSSSGCGDSTNTTSSSLVSDAFNRFGSKRNSRQQLTTKPIQMNKRQSFQDQLSPYAVSSICANVPHQQPPPPMNSEAMRALNEQFDINQLMLMDEPGTMQQQQQQMLPFNPPPPPEANDRIDGDRSSQPKKTLKHDQQ